MGLCVSHPRSDVDSAAQTGVCDLKRLPTQLLVHILSLLEQKELFGTAPLVCKAWRHAATSAAQSLQVNLAPLVQSPAKQLQLPKMLLWMHHHGQQLQQLDLSTSAPLGLASRRALLRCLAAKPANPKLQLQHLALQMDLDNADLEYLTTHLLKHAPLLQSLRLQPVRPSLQDLQLMVLACILGNLVGMDAAGPVLLHLDACSGSVQQLATTATQLRSLSLSRYSVSSTACIATATQLTELTLQHCGLTDGSLGGLELLGQLQRLELSDNSLTAAGLASLTHLTMLTHLDISVMPSISRMRSSETGDIRPLGKLQHLKELNIIGFGVQDASPLSILTHLSRIEAGLNPLSTSSLRVIGQLPELKHLELGGLSQAWVLASSLPPHEALRLHDASWFGLNGMQHLTHLDLGGSNFSHAAWVCHICPVLANMPQLQRLQLAHCHIPTGQLVQLLPALRESLQELNLDRCSCTGSEVEALLSLTRLTRLSVVSLAPKLGNKQASVLSGLTSLRHLCARSNDFSIKGLQVLAKGLTQLTALDVGGNVKVGKRCVKQLSPLLRNGEAAAAWEESAGRYW